MRPSINYSTQTIINLTTKILFTRSIAVTFTAAVFFHNQILVFGASPNDKTDIANFDFENSVGYGEDCSNEGPFCDIRQHLYCDMIEEVCVCDDKNGYVHVGNLEIIPTLFQEDEENEEEYGTSQKRICMKSSDLEHKLDRLLNMTRKIKDFTDILRKYQKYLPKKYLDLLKDEGTVEWNNSWCVCQSDTSYGNQTEEHMQAPSGRKWTAINLK